MARKVQDAIPSSGNGPDYNVFTQHSTEITIALIKKAEADSILQHAYKRAKSAGFNLDEFKRAHKAKKAGWDVTEQNDRDFTQYTAWLGKPIGTQGAMFSAIQRPTEKGLAEMAERDAEQAGYTAGTRGSDLSECPHKPGHRLHAAWVRGLHGGIAFLEGRGGEPAPRIEQVAPRPAGSRKGRASAPEQTSSAVVRKPGRPRKVLAQFAPDVPTTLDSDESDDRTLHALN